MESWIIILGVIIVIIAYFLIKYYFFSVQYSVSKKYLKNDSVAISLGKDKSTRSINYSFGSWIYVNNFSDTVIYSYIIQGAVASVENPSTFALILGGVDNSSLGGTGIIGSRGTPVLTAYINGATTTPTTRVANTVTITNNFPIQKWVHVLVSVDTTYVDCYIDGKLIISKPLTNQITSEIGSTTSTADSNIVFQSPGPDIWLTQLNRWSKPLDPQSVWDEYYKGNGLSQMGDIELIFDIKYNP
jgi:hypothetical protein